MATLNALAAKRQNAPALEVTQVEEKAASVFEQIDALKGDFPDRRLLRTALLEWREHMRESKARHEDVKALLEGAQELFERADALFRRIEDEDEEHAEIVEVTELPGDQEVEVPPPQTWENKLKKVELRGKKVKLRGKKVELRAKNDKRKHRKLRREAELTRQADADEDTRFERRTFLWLTVASVTAVIVFAMATMVLTYLTTLHGQPANFAAPGATLALTGVMTATATLSERSRRLAVAAADAGKAKKRKGDERPAPGEQS